MMLNAFFNPVFLIFVFLGWQFRNVTCAGRNTLEPVDRELCDSNNEPEEKRRCSEVACEAQWVPYPWKECSAPCGEGGTQTRDIFCQQIVSNGQPTLADDSECLKSQPKPPTEQKCNVGKICSKWFTGPWKPVSSFGVNNYISLKCLTKFLVIMKR